MAIVTLVSGSGAPGVTTSALAFALSWPRPCLLIEAGPAAGSALAAGWFHGAPPHNRGLINLAMQSHRQDLDVGLHEVAIPIEGSTAAVVTGVRSTAQIRHVADLWGPLADTLRGLEHAGTDVLVDAGRLGMTGFPGPLVLASDVVLLTARTNLPAVSGARAAAVHLRADLAAAGLDDTLGLLIVGGGKPYSSAEVGKALALPVLGDLAWEPRQAEAFSLGRPGDRSPSRPWRGLERGALIRSVRAAGSAVQSAISRHRVGLQQRLSPAEQVAGQVMS